MMPDLHHHPKPDTLADYAAGRLDEARGVVVATHNEMCAACRLQVSDLEALGGLCLAGSEPVAMNAPSMAAFWERAGEQEVPLPGNGVRIANDIDLLAAPPLRRFLKGGLDNIAWKQVAPGLSQHILDADGYRDGVLRLLKISPGTRMPTHTHSEEELTLVLRGAYKDQVGEFRPGDLADLNDGVMHAPEAFGDEDCICLIATNAPLVFKDLIGKVMQPFVRL